MLANNHINNTDNIACRNGLGVVRAVNPLVVLRVPVVLLVLGLVIINLLLG
jgi:hypothetical protein